MFRYSRCWCVSRGLQGQFRHAHDAVHGRADFMAHVGQELALGPIGLLGRFLRQPQFVFAAAQLGGGPFQFGIGNGELPRPGLGGGGAFGHALLQGLVQALQLGEAFGIFQGSAGNGGDELGQALLVRAEKIADLAVVDVEAAGRPAAHEDRRTQSRADAGQQGAVLFGLRPRQRR